MAECDAWCAAEGPGLHRFALHQALSDRFGPYWPDWPAPYRNPASPQVAAFAAANPQALRLHAWAQWRAHVALGNAADMARAAGMAQGLYLDLAVGTHPRGAETWADPDAFAQGMSLGAPPDAFAPEGQTWGLAPLRPDVLCARGMAPLADTLRAQFRYAGMLRVDHILGFERAFWVPDGLPGLYVRMPKAEMLATLRLEAARAGAVAVGEDLGNTPETLREDMRASGILGCRAAMFERDWDGDGAFLAPETHTPQALASVGTHDLPTWRGWRAGQEIDGRARLGDISPEAAAQARATRTAEVAAFDALTGDTTGDALGLHRFLARSAARLVAVQAEDVFDCLDQPNLPGTIHSHPNWRRRLPVSVDAMADDPRLRATAAVMAKARRAPPAQNHRSPE
jgi:4-alpha-glucanotransferase